MGSLSPVAFGRELVLTEDLDPVYCILARAQLSPSTIKAFLLAYWCFYDPGTASDITSSPDYWDAMMRAAQGRARRGTERRHFRGKLSTVAVKFLRDQYESPVMALDWLTLNARSFAAIAGRVREWPGFGSWIAFKVADMVERVLKLPVDFSTDDLVIYSEPLAGAKLIASDLPAAVALLEESLGEMMAPPGGDRRLNIQEYETILCKFKSHVHGHYEVGHDTIEVKRALARSGSPLARHLMRQPIGAH